MKKLLTLSILLLAASFASATCTNSGNVTATTRQTGIAASVQVSLPNGINGCTLLFITSVDATLWSSQSGVQHAHVVNLLPYNCTGTPFWSTLVNVNGQGRDTQVGNFGAGINLNSGLCLSFEAESTTEYEIVNIQYFMQ